jgi:uncharacterized cofD-like protein
MSNALPPRTQWSLLFRPGLHVKRWLLLMVVGVTVATLGFAFLIRHWYLTNQFPALLHILTLSALPDWARGLLMLTFGLTIVTLSLLYLSRTLMLAVIPGQTQPNSREMDNAVLERQRRRQGPRIVAIGGGTGMPQLLRGLRAYTDNITAIVTVADDGGSSGRLRRQTGTLPPGDFRNNIAALSEAEGLMTRLFQYRFAESDLNGVPGQRSELAGHSFGNLFITTMAAITGSFESGIAESSRVLAVRGRILPSTLENVTLCAEVKHTTADGHTEWVMVEGESNVPKAGGQVERVYLQPAHARAYPEAIRAILQADLIVAGPGSFFTSVLPNLLVESIRDAITASAAMRIYICNVATQHGETDDYSVLDHLRRLRQHAGDAFMMTLANDNYTLDTPPAHNASWVTLPAPGDAVGDFKIFTGDVVDVERPWRHDSQKLAARLMAVYQEYHAKSPKV